MSFYKLSNNTLVSAISVLVMKIFTKIKNCSDVRDVYYLLTDYSSNSIFIDKHLHLSTQSTKN